MESGSASPRPQLLYAQQRSVGAKDSAAGPPAFSSQAIGSDSTSLLRSQVLRLDAGHARVHLSPRGVAECVCRGARPCPLVRLTHAAHRDRSACAEKRLRELLHGSASPTPVAGSPRGQQSSVRDNLTRLRLVQRSEAASKLRAHQRTRADERRETGGGGGGERAARSDASPSAARAAVPHPEASPSEGTPLYGDTAVSQWAEYSRRRNSPTAVEVRASQVSLPRGRAGGARSRCHVPHRFCGAQARARRRRRQRRRFCVRRRRGSVTVGLRTPLRRQRPPCTRPVRHRGLRQPPRKRYAWIAATPSAQTGASCADACVRAHSTEPWTSRPGRCRSKPSAARLQPLHAG